jgi:DNA-binding NarL/FixJ family response regulator
MLEANREQSPAPDVRRRKVTRVVLLVADSLLSEVLAAAVRRVDGMELVLATDGGVEALEVVGRRAVDVVVIDSDGDSPVRLRQEVDAFRAVSNDVRVVALTSVVDGDAIARLVESGVDGAISKSILSTDFGYVLRQAGQNTLFGFMPPTPNPPVRADAEPPPIAEAALPETPQFNGADSPLTKRELEILALVSEGAGNKQIAKKLWVTEQTVKFHLSNIYRKLHVSNRTEASRAAQTSGLLGGPLVITSEGSMLELVVPDSGERSRAHA